MLESGVNDEHFLAQPDAGYVVEHDTSADKK